MKKMQIIMALALSATLGAYADTWDGTAWSEDFTGLSALPGNMELGAAQGSGTTSVGSDQVNWSTTDYRQFVRTTATNYCNFDFTYEATVTIDGTIDHNTIFMGLGPADVSAWMPTLPDISVSIDPRTDKGGAVVIEGAFQEPHFAPNLADGTYRLRMEFDASTEGATLSIHTNYAGGAFIAHYSETRFHPGYATDDDSRLYFGGGSGCTFDDISVTNHISAPIDPPGIPSMPPWSEDFTGLTNLPSNLELGPAATPGSITVGSGVVTWDPPADYRQMVRTKAPYTRYNLVNFIFEATATVSGDAFGAATIGLGEGRISGYLPQGTAVTLLAGPTGWNKIQTYVNSGLDQDIPGVIGDGTHRLRLEWNKTNEVATFSVDVGYTGTFTADQVVTVTNTGFTGASDASLYFGGGYGVVFDDISFNNLDWEPTAEPEILSLTSMGGGIMKMVVNAPSDAERYEPKAKTDLVIGGTWTNVPHSYTNTLGSMVETNLSYSAAEGTNEVIYVDGSAATKFFKITAEQ